MSNFNKDNNINLILDLTITHKEFSNMSKEELIKSKFFNIIYKFINYKR